MNNLSYSHKRLVLLVSLSEFLGNENLVSALLLWEKKYSEVTLSEMRDLLYDIKNALNVNIDFTKFVMTVNRASFKTERELFKISVEISDDITQQGIANDEKEVLLRTFDDLIKAWQNLLPPETKNNVKIYVLKNLHLQDFDTRTSMFFLSWFSEKKETVKMKKVDVEALKKIVNLFYVACCEYVGPVNTDKFLNRITHELMLNYNEVEQRQLKKLL